MECLQCHEHLNKKIQVRACVATANLKCAKSSAEKRMIDEYT